MSMLDARWRAAVEETVASQTRLRDLVSSCRPGPLQDRLESLTARVDAGVSAAWQIATRAQAASRTVDAMRVSDVQAQLKDARRRLAAVQQAGGDASREETEVALLSDQHSALNQLLNAIEEAAERLRLLDLRLDAAVARAAQIVLRPDQIAELAGVDAEVSLVVDELNALRAGLDAVSTTAS